MAFEVITTAQLIERLAKFTHKQLHIHHTWRPNKANFNGKNHLSLQSAMFDYHTKTNGWSDIGQHVTLMPDGSWVTGRAFDVAPASIKGWNEGAFAVEMVGDFDLGRDKLEGHQREAIIELARYFLRRYCENSIKFHNEGPGVTKSCPGTGIIKSQFMQEVKGQMDDEYKDVKANRWSARHIRAAKKLGIMMGDDQGNFNPTQPITREEMAVVAMRLYESITGKKVIV